LEIKEQKQSLRKNFAIAQLLLFDRVEQEQDRAIFNRVNKCLLKSPFLEEKEHLFK